VNVSWVGWARWATGPCACLWVASCQGTSCIGWADTMGGEEGPTLARHCAQAAQARQHHAEPVFVAGQNLCFGLTHGPCAIWPSILSGDKSITIA
jgi:hypothetical protein